MEEIEEKFGDPWTVLPIKNARYARDCTEVHLASRGLVGLQNFGDFPNLEVVWLNQNKVNY